jgi:hypothetical protein
MWRLIRDWLFTGVALLALLAHLVAAFWPVPGKYPWGLPVVVLAAAAAAVYRWRRHADDFGSMLIPLGAVGALSLWTLFFKRGDESAFLLWLALLGLPVGRLLLALIHSGSADDPYADDA